jgi:nitrous oxidase accessory protein NosD
MRKSVALLLLVLALLTAPCMIMFLPVQAEYRTIVVPDDYPTISSAIGNATAGDTIFVKKGTYEEQTLTINKTLSLTGEDAESTVINLHPPYNETTILTQTFYDYSNALIIVANDVRVSNLTIVAKPGGYTSVIGDRIQITSNYIKADNTAATDLFVRGSSCEVIGNALSGGILLKNANYSKISQNTCMYLQLGYENQNSLYNIISGNKIETKTGYAYGISIGNGSHNVFYNNYLGRYSYDLNFGNGVAENNTFYHNNFVNNSLNQVNIYKSNLLLTNHWDNGEEGNFWDDYNGTDDNRDGIGDTPYVINGDNIDHYPLMEPFDVEGDAIVLPPPAPFPVTLVAAAFGVSVAVIGVGLLVYFKKRKH